MEFFQREFWRLHEILHWHVGIFWFLVFPLERLSLNVIVDKNKGLDFVYCSMFFMMYFSRMQLCCHKVYANHNKSIIFQPNLNKLDHYLRELFKFWKAHTLASKDLNYNYATKSTHLLYNSGCYQGCKSKKFGIKAWFFLKFWMGIGITWCWFQNRNQNHSNWIRNCYNLKT